MRIAVTDIGRAFGRQTRAYAEYRVFSSLARFGGVVHQADVSLTRLTLNGSVARCRVAVTLEGGHRLRVSARGRHVYDAINCAARHIGDAVRQHADIAMRR